MRAVPWERPRVDEWYVRKVLSGQYSLALRPGEPSVGPEETTDTYMIDATCPTGTRPCPQGSKSIHVWGVSTELKAKELLDLCHELGKVHHLEMLKPQADCGTACARMTFGDSSSAQKAIWSFQGMKFDNKVRSKHGPGGVAIE
jgi:hypothetical protein